jgi:UDP-2,3-diacylglucosamine hydrolase
MSQQSPGKHVFIADLHHPGGQDEEINELFSQIPSGATHLYFLGDTFHYWINDPDFISLRYHDFFERLKDWANKGLQLFFLEGNRDFLASHFLEEEPWIDVLMNPSILDISGRCVYVGHGDELCWNDWPYQMYKSVIRSTPMRFLADHLPDTLRRSAVKRMSEASAKIVAGKAQSMLQIPEKAYTQIIDSGVDVIIHGHLHQTYQREIQAFHHSGSVISFGWKDEKRNIILLD